MNLRNFLEVYRILMEHSFNISFSDEKNFLVLSFERFCRDIELAPSLSRALSEASIQPRYGLLTDRSATERPPLQLSSPVYESVSEPRESFEATTRASLSTSASQKSIRHRSSNCWRCQLLARKKLQILNFEKKIIFS